MEIRSKVCVLGERFVRISACCIYLSPLNKTEGWTAAVARERLIQRAAQPLLFSPAFVSSAPQLTPRLLFVVFRRTERGSSFFFFPQLFLTLLYILLGVYAGVHACAFHVYYYYYSSGPNL